MNMLKKEIRVIGIDDSPFDKFKKGKVLVVGTVFRGGLYLDGILSTKVIIDGNDATTKIIEMINKCKFKPQLQCIFLDGIAVGGFNVIDIKELNSLFNMKGLYLTNIIGKTKGLKMSDSPRGKEILQWLSDNNKENSIYFIIDDDIDYDIIQHIDKKHCIKTYFKDGFTNELKKELINRVIK